MSNELERSYEMEVGRPNFSRDNRNMDLTSRFIFCKLPACMQMGLYDVVKYVSFEGGQAEKAIIECRSDISVLLLCASFFFFFEMRCL